jgi:glutamate racemase
MRIVAFDSGVGGLSVIAPLFKKIPNLNVHYLGDIANLPYGTKSPERVRALTLKNLKWLLATMSPGPQAGDLCLIACNTASAEALSSCQTELAAMMPVIGVIEASCADAIQQNSKSIAVLATPATVRSGAYETILRKKGFGGNIQQIACPLFVPFVEEAILEGPAIDWVVDRYLGSKIKNGDAIILGCTHYPYLLPILKKKFPASHFTQAGEALLSSPDFLPLLNAQKPSDLKSHLRITVTDSNANREQIAFFLKQLGMAELSWSLDVIAPI